MIVDGAAVSYLPVGENFSYVGYGTWVIAGAIFSWGVTL